MENETGGDRQLLASLKQLISGHPYLAHEQQRVDRGDYVVSVMTTGEPVFGYVAAVMSQTLLIDRFAASMAAGPCMVPRVNWWPVDEATFEWAQEYGFRFDEFPPELYGNVMDRLTELSDHLIAMRGLVD